MVAARTLLGGFVAATLIFSTAATGSAGAGSMVLGDYTSQPIGHYDFCQRVPEECEVRPFDYGPLRLSRVKWNLIVEVNNTVNREIKPLSDLEIFGVDEFWAYPEELGDCEDYVLEKRRRLNAAGIPLANLLITVVRKPDGEGHAILTVRTDHGDFILDNLTDKVMPWAQTGYLYLKRQAISHTGRWVAIDSQHTQFVGSVD